MTDFGIEKQVIKEWRANKQTNKQTNKQQIKKRTRKQNDKQIDKQNLLFKISVH